MRCEKLFSMMAVGFASLLALNAATAIEPTYAALDPRGTWPTVARIPLSPRLQTLTDKRIYLILSWDHESGLDQASKDLAAALEASGAKAIIKNRNVRYSEDDPTLWAEIKKERADGFLYLAAASSSTTSYAFKWSAQLEASGLPGGVVALEQLIHVGKSTNEREGAQIRAVSFEFPTDTMDKQSYQAAIARSIAMLKTALTVDEQRTGTQTPTPPPKVAATGDLNSVQRIFYDKELTDGLPIIPPTEAKVVAMLKGTSHASSEIVAKNFYPDGLQVSVRQVAINAVMAGCEPEHMPVLLAAIEAMQKFNLNSMLRSTNSFALMQVVNGPIAKELHMNAGVNALGPGNRANAAMGRALRLFIINLGGGHPGANINAVIGNNAAYGFMFAENESQSPWESFSVTKGFRKDESTLSLFSGGWSHAGNYNLGTPFERVLQDIARFELMSGATLIISPQRAEELKRRGMSKADVIDYVWKGATRPLGELRHEQFFRETPEMKSLPESTLVPVFPKGSIEVVVAGGEASPMMQAWHMYRPQTVSIDRWR